MLNFLATCGKQRQRINFQFTAQNIYFQQIITRYLLYCHKINNYLSRYRKHWETGKLHNHKLGFYEKDAHLLSYLYSFYKIDSQSKCFCIRSQSFTGVLTYLEMKIRINFKSSYEVTNYCQNEVFLCWVAVVESRMINIFPNTAKTPSDAFSDAILARWCFLHV